ncbi:PQQ-binding-like beta-propeller repeat protein [Streptomyces sp. CNQ-509]|uniref:serine/threonine-protein kinase n=1 Tax=Streptomyces sp. CNQ-509 TaxID=444103 RepID=UPI00069C5161|nr:serine/threonine-protein kinase [Streptomyces sp. CNQ-509]
MAELEHGDPREIGGYRVLKRLGAGGMGVVYLGRSPAGTLVAVKVVRPRLVVDGRYRARFRREVAAARRVTGAYTAPLVGADPDADPPWLATAYLPGLSLDEAVGTFGALPAPVVRLLAAALAEALAGIHGAGLVHRDFKPGNIMLTPGGPRVIDFGIARPEDSATLTQDGALIGTPGFMSPEQAAGGRAGPPADVFALGSVLAYATTGRAPFDAGNRIDTLRRIQRGQADLAGVQDRRLRSVVAACLRAEPRRRPAAAALLDLLGEPAESVHGTRWLPAALAEEIDAPSARAPWPGGGAAGSVRPGEATADPFAGTAATGTGEAGEAGEEGEARGALRPRRRALLVALTAAGVAGAGALTRPLLDAFDDSPPAGGHRPRTDSGARAAPPAEAAEVWRVRARYRGESLTGLHAAGGVVFAHGGEKGGVQALDPRTGDESWHRRWGSGGDGEFTTGAGAAYLVGPRGAGTQRVLALAPASGGERWTYAEEFGIFHAVAAADGLTYVATGGIVALDSRSGDERWSDGTTAFSFTTGSGFVVADDGEEVHALDAAGGGKRWSHPAENSTAVLAADGLVFVCDAYLRLVALAAADGAVAWEKELVYPSTVHAAGDGILYLTEDRRFHACHADTGEAGWSLPGVEFAGLAGGAVHVWGSVAEDGTTGGRPRLYALDPSGGDVLWTYGGAEYVHVVAAGPAGLVFAGLPDGYVQALRPPTARRPNGGTSGAP